MIIIKQIERERKSQGYALLMAIIIMGIFILISFYIADFSFREGRVDRSLRDAQIALSAQNSGVECAMRHDRRQSSEFNSSSGDITCNGNSGVRYTETFNNVYEFILLTGDGACAVVRVDKRGSGRETVVTSRGYNICPNDASGNPLDPNPRRIEQATEVKYTVRQEPLKDVVIAVDTSSSMLCPNARPIDGGCTQSDRNYPIAAQTCNDNSTNRQICDDYENREVTHNGTTKKGTAIRDMKEEVKSLIDQLDSFGIIDEDSVKLSLVEFGQNNRIMIPLDDNVSQMKMAVDDLRARGNTSLQGGIILGADVLVEHPETVCTISDCGRRGGVDKVMIIVSDGLPTYDACVSNNCKRVVFMDSGDNRCSLYDCLGGQSNCSEVDTVANSGTPGETLTRRGQIRCGTDSTESQNHAKISATEAKTSPNDIDIYALVVGGDNPEDNSTFMENDIVSEAENLYYLTNFTGLANTLFEIIVGEGAVWQPI